MPSGCSTPAQFSINNGKLQLDFPPFVSPCSGNSADYKIFTTAGETYTVSMKMERGVATDVIAIETRDHINNTVIPTAVWGINIQPGVLEPCIEYTFTATSAETRLKIFSRSDAYVDPTVLYIDQMQILAYERILADVVSFSDYYPFGMQMPNRNQIGDSYRYGMNGMEKDNEISGSGNSYTAPFWQYDTRLGRRWNRDPKPNPAISDYACFAGNPILYSDPLGDTIVYASSNTKKFNRMVKNRIWIMKNFGPKKLRKLVRDVQDDETEIVIESSVKIVGKYKRNLNKIILAKHKKMYKQNLVVGNHKKGKLHGQTMFGVIANELSHAEDDVNNNTKSGSSYFHWGVLIGGKTEKISNSEIESNQVENMAVGMFFWMRKREEGTHVGQPVQSWSFSERNKFKRLIKLYVKDEKKGTILLDKYINDEAISSDTKKYMKLWTKGSENYSPSKNKNH